MVGYHVFTKIKLCYSCHLVNDYADDFNTYSVAVSEQSSYCFLVLKDKISNL